MFFRMVLETGYLALAANLPPPERLRERGRSFHTRLMRLLALSFRYEIVGPEADLSEAPFLFASLSATSFPVTPPRPGDRSREMERFQQDPQTVCTKERERIWLECVEGDCIADNAEALPEKKERNVMEVREFK